MYDYVQVRLETSSSSVASVNHDFRLSKVTYLRDDMFHNKWKNQYFDYDPKNVKINAKYSFNEYNRLYSDNHLVKYGKRRKITKGKQSDFLTGIVTLSPSVNDKLANEKLSKDELEQCFIKSLERVKSLLENEVSHELELFHHVIHYDEKTPHLHFAFSNHTKQGEAVFHKIRTSKNKILSKCQDEVGHAFKRIGFVRGVVKDKTNARHKSVREMHQAEIVDLSANINKLRKEKSDLLERLGQEQLRLKEQINALKVDKKEIKSRVKSLDLSAEAVKSELDDIDIKIRKLRDTLTYDKDLMNDVKYILEQYESSDPDEAIPELLNRINKVDMLHNPEYKLEVSTMLKRFKECRMLHAKEEAHLAKLEENVDIDSLVHSTSSSVRRKK